MSPLVISRIWSSPKNQSGKYQDFLQNHFYLYICSPDQTKRFDKTLGTVPLERWVSGWNHRFAKPTYVSSVPRVRISSSPRNAISKADAARIVRRLPFQGTRWELALIRVPLNAANSGLRSVCRRWLLPDTPRCARPPAEQISSYFAPTRHSLSHPMWPTPHSAAGCVGRSAEKASPSQPMRLCAPSVAWKLGRWFSSWEYIVG